MVPRHDSNPSLIEGAFIARRNAGGDKNLPADSEERLEWGLESSLPTSPNENGRTRFV